MAEQLNFTLEQFGLTPEVLGDRVVEIVARQLTTSIDHDENGDEVETRSPFIRGMQDQVKKLVDAKVQEIAERDLLPRITEMVETIVLQRSNEWGEKRGASMSFVEYLTARADAYLREPTDSSGRAKGEPGASAYDWRATTTRLAGLIDRHLHYSIATAMEAALKDLNKTIVGGLEGVVREQLQQIAGKIKIVSTEGR